MIFIYAVLIILTTLVLVLAPMILKIINIKVNFLIIIGVWFLITFIFFKAKFNMGFRESAGLMAGVIFVSFFVSLFVEAKIKNIPFVQKLLNKTAVTAPAVTGKAAGKATVSAESANFRDKASTESNILQKVKKGDVLTIRGAEESGWLPVEFDGKEGFISADMVTISK